MNMAILRGRLSSAPRTTQLASGDELVRYEVTVPREGEPADTVPVAWLSPTSVPSLDAGDEVVVVGRVRRRFFGGGGGPARSSTEVLASIVLPATRRAAAQKAVAAAVASIHHAAGG